MQTSTVARKARHRQPPKLAPYETKDWIEASLLRYIGVPLLRLRWLKNVCFFEFERTPDIIPTLESFHKGELVINLKGFIETQREVKRILHRGEPK